TSIGTTIENRPIWMVKISDNVGVDENEPEVLFDALHHAREPLSMEATVVFMDWLVTSYGSDPEATFLVDERELYFVPCVNPDGYEYNYQQNPGGGGLWRKNRRNNGGSFGVDLNRNYATAWNAPNGGSSATPTSETYRGTAPFSEPEAQAIEAFAQSRAFVTVFTTHTYGDVLLRPWGYQLGDPANVASYDALGAYYTAENGIPHGSISGLLYIAAGSAVDHHHTVRGTHCLSAELGTSGEGGFWPSGAAIVDIATRHQPMFHKVALTAGAALRIADVAVTEGPGGNGNGTVEPGEGGDVVVEVANVGLAATSAAIAIQSLTPGLTVQNGSAGLGALAAQTSVQNGAPLTFVVAAGVTVPTAQLRVVATGDGRTSELVVPVDLVPRRLTVRDDFELDRGFARAAGGTATTGLWERAAPQQTQNGSTVIQPGQQQTPLGSLCWVTDGRGGSAGTYDVDGGFTELESPAVDLSHLLSAELRLAYWYAESVGDDPMTIELSRDGGANWSPLFARANSTGTWQDLSLDLGVPLTDRMKLRVRAQDLNPSLVECLIDDLEIWGQLADGSITLLGSGAPGTNVEAAINATPNALCFALASFGTGPGQTYPGLGGALLLDPAAAIALPLVVADADGRAEREITLPGGGGFPGVVLHWQAVTFTASAGSFGPNRTALALQ
ncbi:MAG: zinc carboxypeptidase, partial [Planctomycetes bacterium]|nr:zinc carboxypeptidase [Planctomycetota bacterium]